MDTAKHESDVLKALKALMPLVTEAASGANIALVNDARRAIADAEKAAQVVHLSDTSVALCGADEPNQRTTPSRAETTCLPCVAVALADWIEGEASLVPQRLVAAARRLTSHQPGGVQ